MHAGTTRVQIVKTDDPEATTIAVMRRAAVATSKTWAMQRWAAELAAQAPPRDYLAQLRKLYAGVIRRWRYTQEPGERVMADPPRVLGYTLGAYYQPACADDPTRCRLSDAPERNGWGDCDDIATAIAAGVLALGMRAAFRVVRHPGGAHVSVLATTPSGEQLSLDPVGHPKHGPGWAFNPQGAHVRLYPVEDNAPMMIASAAPAHLAGLSTGKRSSGRMMLGAAASHMVAVHPAMPTGQRYLSAPARDVALMRRGLVREGCVAVDQHGQRFRYLSGHDLWVPMGRYTVTGPMGSTRSERKARRVARRRKVLRKIKRAFRKIARVLTTPFRAVVKAVSGLVRKVVSSPAAKGAAAAALAAFGVPPAVTVGAFSALSSALNAGKEPTPKLQQFATAYSQGNMQAAAAALQGAPMGNVDADQGVDLVVVQDGWQYIAAPVAAIGAFGDTTELDPVARSIQTTPTPGAWYKIQKGDDLLTVTGKAFGVGSGGTRLKLSQMVNASPANACYLVAPKSDFGKKYYAGGIISFLPQWSGEVTEAARCASGGTYAVIWIPASAGDLPPPEPPKPQPLPPPPEPEPEPEPPIPVPPEPPIPEPPIPEPQPLPPPPPPDPTDCPDGYVWSSSKGRCILKIEPGPIPIPPTPQPEPEPPAPTPACPPNYARNPFPPFECVWMGPPDPYPVPKPPTPQPGPTPQPQPQPQPTPSGGSAFPWMIPLAILLGG